MHSARSPTSALSRNAYHPYLPMTYKHSRPMSQADRQTQKFSYIHTHSSLLYGYCSR